MSTHPRRRLALALAIAGTLAGGTLAGPAMAASDDDPAASTVGNSGDHVTVRTAGGEPPELITIRKAGGDTGYIIAVL